MDILIDLVKQADGSWSNELSTLLSQASQVYFNVMDDAVQQHASKLIAQIFDQLQKQGNVEGVTAAVMSPSTKELHEFIARCVADIEDNPESMSAGLANDLLKQIVGQSNAT